MEMVYIRKPTDFVNEQWAARFAFLLPHALMIVHLFLYRMSLADTVARGDAISIYISNERRDEYKEKIVNLHRHTDRHIWSPSTSQLTIKHSFGYETFSYLYWSNITTKSVKRKIFT